MSSSISQIKDTVAGSTPSGKHLAAILPSMGSLLQVTQRATPSPGPNQLLIEVKSIALNPIDYYQRDHGFAIASYPAVVGSDTAGIVVSAGSAVPSDAPKPGTRVSAFAPCFFMKGAPDYGALQTRVLVPAVNAVPLPQGLSFNEASLLPMGVLTAWSGWYSIGIPRDTTYTAADKKGMLVWGGASSIGSAAVQIAKLMGFTVYTTASKKNHEYLKGLGASKVFDYRGEHVVENIVKAAKEDEVTVQFGFDAVGQLTSCLEILKELKGEGTAKLASAVPLPEHLLEDSLEDVEVKFVAAPVGVDERMEFFHFVFGVWLKDKLEKGEFVPSPRIQVVDGGLESANKALDVLKKGVSGLKLVLEV
jgi:NADPH:quinone reductase-like Zn-dependent oxidoreductase